MRRVLLTGLFIILITVGMALGAAALFRMSDFDPVAILENLLGPGVDTARLEQVIRALRVPLDMLTILLAFVVAYLVSRSSHRLSGWILSAASVARSSLDGDVHAPVVRDEPSARWMTLEQLVASLISFSAFTIAIIFALSRFVSLTNLAVLATVLANAFGFAARDYVGDVLNGISNLFEDRFDVGDNIEIVRLEDEVRGIVEGANIRTMSLRTRSGELLVVPQGQVRILRNFTRGAFTGTDVTVTVGAGDLARAMSLLADLSWEAPSLLPNLIEPWDVHSQAGDVSTQSALVIHAKAVYGRGSELRLEIMSLVQERLAAADIPLAG